MGAAADCLTAASRSEAWSRSLAATWNWERDRVGSGLGCVVRYVLIVVILLFGLKGATAARFEVERLDAGSALITLDGDLELADIDSFRSKIASLSRATVAFRSDGGSLLAGIRIGMLIRVNNFITVVPDGAQCASACAVAWLGGARRFMGMGSRVGFHAAYVQKAGATSESGPGNAVLGAYLDQLGLPEDAIVYITQAGPSSMKWLTMDEAGEHGIDVTLLPPAEPVVASVEPSDIVPDRGGAEALQARVTDFVLSWAERWSEPNAQSLHVLDTLYADQVHYHGKLTTRADVLLDKHRFAEKWPQRSYKIRPRTISASCDATADTCRVRGVMDRTLANAKTSAKSRDVSSFELSVARSGDDLRIAAETSSLSNKQDLSADANPLVSVQRGLEALLAQVSRIRQAPADGSAPLRPSAPIPH